MYLSVSKTLSSGALAALAMTAATNAKIAEAKDDRSAVVHYHVTMQEIAQELERRERSKIR